LAPPVQHAVRFAQPSQTILVTHYLDCTPFLASSANDHNSNMDMGAAPVPAPSSPHASPLHYYTLQKDADRRRRRRGRALRSSAVPHPVNGAPPWAFESTDAQARSMEDDKDDKEVEEEEEEQEEANIHDDAEVSAEEEGNPWPKEHEAFRASSLAQQRMCLEIASGCPVRRPEVRTTGPNQTVLIPGSLRERGEFSVVQVSLRETPFSSHDDKVPAVTTTTATATPAGPSPLAAGSIHQDRGSRAGEGTGERRAPKSSPVPPTASSTKPSSHPKRTFSWVVQDVDFHRLNERKA
jgi:hypothetical protein